jgi:hypothetical protein
MRLRLVAVRQCVLRIDDDDQEIDIAAIEAARRG